MTVNHITIQQRRYDADSSNYRSHSTMKPSPHCTVSYNSSDIENEKFSTKKTFDLMQEYTKEKDDRQQPTITCDSGVIAHRKNKLCQISLK